MSCAMAGMALEQGTAVRVPERQNQRVLLGEIQRALHRVLGSPAIGQGVMRSRGAQKRADED